MSNSKLSGFYLALKPLLWELNVPKLITAFEKYKYKSTINWLAQLVVSLTILLTIKIGICFVEILVYDRPRIVL